MRRLAVFADGTWNVPPNNTNVWRMYLLTADRDATGEQLAYYHEGIGTGATNRVRGAFGKGINANVRNCYQWLVRHYCPGDQIFIFGFSRGAYIARSLAGFIERCGLLRPGAPISVREAFARYRTAFTATQGELPLRPDDGLQRHFRAVEIEFLGVWDTVRYHDVPFGSVRGLSRSQNLFHVVQPTRAVRHIYHALAVDEHRAAYKPEPFLLPAEEGNSPTLEQRWFAGAHSNVGGGYREDTLAVLPLAWMQQKAHQHGLRFKESVPLYGDEHLGQLTDSFGEFLGGAYRVLSGNRRHVRKMNDSMGPGQVIDASVFDRWRASADYRPDNIGEWASSRGLDSADCFGDQRVSA